MRACGAWCSEPGIRAPARPAACIDAFALPGLNHRVDVFGGVLQEECAALLTDFFEPRRR